MAETMTGDEFIRRIDQRLMDARNCGNCKHFGRRNGGTDICLNPSCRFSKEQTGICDFRLVTNEKFVCNLHEYENKENEND